MRPVDRPARARIQRTLLLAVGIGAVVFGGLLASGANGFLAQIPQQCAPWGVIYVAVGLVAPATLIVLHRALPIRVVLTFAGVTSVTFFVLAIAWPATVIADTLADDATPWIQGINAVHATMAAIVWPRIIGWVYPLALGPLVTITQIQVRDDAALPALLDGMGAVVYCLILCGVSIAMIRAGDQQDAAAATAREQAALEASRRTREAEQARINAIVHDDVMSVLLSASRPQPPAELVQQAHHALARVGSIVTGHEETRDYEPFELVAVLRSTVAALDVSIPVSYAVRAEALVPATVVAAFAEATSEAIRNALRHAGEGAEPAVAIDVLAGEVTVTVDDAGAGFDASRVPDRRLGIRVSIAERMALLDGGSAEVLSKPGNGTTVTLKWSA